MLKLKKSDNRKFRKVVVVNTMNNKRVKVNVLLDTGSVYTIVTGDVADALRLISLGDMGFEHSDGVVEKTYFSHLSIKVKDYDFPIKVVISKLIGSDLLIVGADFMKLYEAVLRFDVKEHDVVLRNIQKKAVVDWDL